jgi:uncharacterized protein YcgI (DUF1989 family)
MDPSAVVEDRRALARKTKPIPCYALEQIPKKLGGEELYTSLAQAVASGKAVLRKELEIPPRDARSWVVKAGEMWRITCHKGPQVADMNCWSLDNPLEQFYSSKTRQIHATHLTTGNRLWSNMPYVRPLATITQDTIAYGWDDDGAGVHDVIGTYYSIRLVRRTTISSSEHKAPSHPTVYFLFLTLLSSYYCVYQARDVIHTPISS